MEEIPPKTNDDSSPLAISQTWASGQPRCSRLCINLLKNNENSSWLCWQILLVISCCLASSGYFPTIMIADEVPGPSKLFSNSLLAPFCHPTSKQPLTPNLKETKQSKSETELKNISRVVDTFRPSPRCLNLIPLQNTYFNESEFKRGGKMICTCII